MQVELLVLNGMVFTALGIGIAIRLRRKPSVPEEQGALYRRVSLAMSRRFPDLPRGFTFREGLARAKPSSPGIDWTSLEKELGSYETFRFGGGDEPTSPASETLKLLRVLGGS